MKYLFLLIFIGTFSSCNEIESKTTLESASQKFADGNYEAAKQEMFEFFKIDPKNKDNITALTILGHIYEALDEDKKAQTAYQKVLKINPNRVEAITGLGILARKQNDYEKAVEYYERAIRIEPDYAQAVSSLSVVHLLRRDFEQAVSIGEKALKLDAEDPVILSNLTIAAYYLQDSIKLEQHYQRLKKTGYRQMEGLDRILSGETTLFPND